ncbi:3-oxoacyl-(acyl-carrier-protein) reductase [Chthonomonas calidirosea]|uniref:3-oxoacyl-[acyl-carrier-protein] reductase n=1 Tax=Chthonomonas calidirosea (strain DSM 23976 / ICMP 18418 / T49) TaxID=1303518 RepID=S0ESV2_CHTCT|nr:3-oxoacyl-[acyl-carrier-protein] reductase [Chthonomonas calidirosea]CCW34075.1 3-oxoacyl-[acyl-carrier-protein] reductase [Chthonomonas calidirosea T49]CEK14687.1 3-oxoacyl-(acyl-carrier-protein) reductase [Chthonomonas calidirosea]CEK15825.1 3-oxoacyl-(acyl-carrier-protein) reductase [Chthonomonas calidirosea]
MKLQNRVAIVTGASRGIGKAIALELAAEGAKVVINYNRNAASAEETARVLLESGKEAFAFQADVADASQVEKLVQSTIERFGRVDILINNAGVTRDKLVMRMSEEDWDAVLNTNLKGAFLCSRAVTPIFLRQRSGVIVNISSVIGKVGGPGQANYSASKAGLIGLTKSLAKELGSRNIRVNAIAPGFIETEMTDVLKPEQREAALKQIPLARFGGSREVARVAVFLCSDDASYIHGEVITVDGGLYM